MRRHHNSQTGRKAIRVFQANVGKIPPAHDCALALADAEHTRPRVMTYVRRRPGLTADQRRPATTRDILWLTINSTTIVNCYRQPDFDGALDILLAWSPPSRCLVAGDFNAKHYSWQTGRLDGRGDDIAHWAAENRLSLLNLTDVPTNPRGNTIDLAFSNVPLSEAVVEDHLATSSDHFTLSIALPEVGVAPMPPGKVRVTTEDEVKRFVDLVQYGSVDIPAPTTTIHGLDDLASALQTRSALWWTEECRLAAAEYRAIRRVYPIGSCRDVQLAKKDFQKVVRQAKRLYWRNLIDSFNDSAFQPPPLEVDGEAYETQLDKANALRRATLERRTSEDDIPDPWVPVTATRAIPFSKDISLQEVQDATIRTGNTSPGSDNITVKMLKAAWHIIGEHVRRLYEGCLRLGHHPQPFREAEVVMIAKPGRRNLSTPRAWRPISLLSCLGKGLERLIARRLAWASIHYGVLHPQQAGALPKRSAVDLVAALVHDIEEAWMNEKQLHKAVANAPAKLDDLYTRNWDRIASLGEWERRRAFALLRWAAFALRPLTVCEIAEAALIVECQDFPFDDLPDHVNCDYIDSEIIRPCGPLLEVRNDRTDPAPDRQTVHLTHFSVQQFLLRKQPGPDWIQQNGDLRVSQRLQNTMLAQACLTYVSLRHVWEDASDAFTSSFAASFRHYAATTWYQHVNLGLPYDTAILRLCMSFFNRRNACWSFWRKLMVSEDAKQDGKEAETTPPGPLYYAVKLRLKDLAIILADEHDVNETSTLGRSALGVASATGCTEIVRLLLMKGADPKLTTWRGRTPLLAASYGGHVEVVKLLVEIGADIAVASEEGTTALSAAAANGHVEVVELLIEKGADLTVAEERGQSSEEAQLLYSLYHRPFMGSYVGRFLEDLHDDVKLQHRNNAWQVDTVRSNDKIWWYAVMLHKDWQP
ncbi:reverse transcriptase [Purpureocillium lavendulum]|uniref:Reverse transcriptase n=1 Tax=Purpureocillium lavendulum TaxID=1247861 RepID=A0AB34FIH5_9HYPO|nr:reverse transcriptase [Purpureocillium lavendulum]